MSVYVDEIVQTKKTRRWPFGESCHLFADSIEELFEVAGSIGLPPGWLHGVPGFPHFDLTASKRSLAVALGAVEVDRRFAAEHRRKKTRSN